MMSLMSRVRALGVWSRNWLRKRGAVVFVAAGGVVILMAGTGATMAATGVFAAPTLAATTIAASPTPTSTKTVTAASPQPYSRVDIPSRGPWTGVGGPGGVGFRWEGNYFEVTWTGECDRGPIEVWMDAPVPGLGGGGGVTFCDEDQMTGMGTDAAAYWKCYDFTQIWITISGNTPDAGLHKVDVPGSIVPRDCPPGAIDRFPRVDPNSGIPAPTSAPSPTATEPVAPVVTPTVEPTPTPAPSPSASPTSG